MTIKTEANSVLPQLAVPGKLKLITPIKPLYGLTVGCFEIANCGYTHTGVTLKKHHDLSNRKGSEHISSTNHNP
jgi:hypothetical protein